MEAGTSAHDLWVILEPPATFGLRFLQLIQRGEDTIGDGLIREGPKTFRRLDLWGIGRQKEQFYSLGQLELRTAVPACSIQDEQDSLVDARADFFRKGCQRA